MQRLTDYLDFAMDVAWQAGRLTLAHYQTGVRVDRKADRSVVTVADREAEQLIRQIISGRFPDHAVAGEEYGESGPAAASCRWVIDPIDGTSSYVRGVPFWGVLVALEIETVPSVGVCYFPALDDMVAAATGLGCRRDGRSAQVSSVADLSDATLVYTDVRNVSGRLGNGWAALQHDTAFQRSWGDCYGHCLVATGRADVMLDPRMHPWDCAALIPILQEAGGRFTDWRGEVTTTGGDAVSSNGWLHEQVLAYLIGAS